MTKRRDFPVDAYGNIVTQKVAVGCDHDHYLTGRQRPFPNRSTNWVGEGRVLVRVRTSPRRIPGQALPLDDGLL